PRRHHDRGTEPEVRGPERRQARHAVQRQVVDDGHLQTARRLHAARDRERLLRQRRRWLWLLLDDGDREGQRHRRRREYGREINRPHLLAHSPRGQPVLTVGIDCPKRSYRTPAVLPVLRREAGLFTAH